MPLVHSSTSPLLVFTRTCACPSPFLNCSRDPGPYRDSIGLGPKQFLMSPLKDCTSNSAFGVLANFKLTLPLTDSLSSCPSGVNVSAAVRSPDTLLNRPRVTSESSIVAWPLTLVMSTSPPTVATRTSPLTSPLTRPLTVCNFRSPDKPVTLKSALTSVAMTALLAGTWTMRCASPSEPQLWAERDTTWMDVRLPALDTSTRSTFSPAVPP